ncbi:unnamed protein product [Tetraodon nigroviridis]|uniref:(spotted green pufferfish) hypothetical protein n=1 Tax=Tetraodon nigroviridis TaxID=99883 RepID=Q4RMU9_TETNG|nr:unnamed protein product [Tetraodon nigroviridis]
MPGTSTPTCTDQIQDPSPERELRLRRRSTTGSLIGFCHGVREAGEVAIRLFSLPAVPLLLAWDEKAFSPGQTEQRFRGVNSGVPVTGWTCTSTGCLLIHRLGLHVWRAEKPRAAAGRNKCSSALGSVCLHGAEQLRVAGGRVQTRAAWEDGREQEAEKEAEACLRERDFSGCLMAPSDGAQSRPRWDDRWASRERPESHLRPRWTEEPPPPSMLGPSPGGAEKFNVAAPKRSGNSEVPQVTGKGPDTSCSSQSVAMDQAKNRGSPAPQLLSVRSSRPDLDRGSR